MPLDDTRERHAIEKRALTKYPINSWDGSPADGMPLLLPTETSARLADSSAHQATLIGRARKGVVGRTLLGLGPEPACDASDFRCEAVGADVAYRRHVFKDGRHTDHHRYGERSSGPNGTRKNQEEQVMESLHPATMAAQALGWVDESTKALIPPVHPATTFIRDADNQYRTGFSYGRSTNPTLVQPEALLTKLEGGAACLTFASGMAAATAVFLALRPGDHIVAPQVMYWGLRNWLKGCAAERGLVVDFVDATSTDALTAAAQPSRTKLIWIETPANPTWAITDIAIAAEIAHGIGARLAIDSTIATPVLTRPIELGADIVMHSATKYLNGHSDVVAGALIAARQDEFWERIMAIRTGNGAILGSFEAWLLLRGMRTLHLRVERCCRTAQAIAEHFVGHRRIIAVLYPGLPDHPGHAVAARQMHGGFGGMLSIRVAGGESAAIAVAGRVSVWKRATSLGGVESLIEHRASIEGAGSPAPPDLLRLSAGIEDSADLIRDLEQALAGTS